MKYIIIILAMFLILIPVHVFAATESLRLSTVIGGGGTINTTDNANFATDASKKVGIGLTEGETNEKLTVDGVVSIKERNIVSDPIAIDPNFGKIYVSSYDSKLYFLSDETVTYDLTAAGKPYALDAADGTPENALYVDNDGNVGIGNSSPGARLEVSGMPVTEKGLVVNKSFVGGGIGSPTGEIIFSDSGIGESGIKIGNKTAGGDFDILNAYYNGKNIFTIQENGYVGIGTTSPHTALEVQGDVTVSGVIIGKTGGPATIYIASSSHVGGSQIGPQSRADYLCDGMSDQVEINEAILILSKIGGGAVYLAEGTYYIDKSIVLASNISLIGTGNATIVKYNGSDSNLSIITGTNVGSILIQNLQIWGNKNRTLPIGITGISFTKGSGIKINNCKIHELSGTGIYFGTETDKSWGNDIISNWIEECTGSGIVFDGGQNSEIINNSIIGCSFAGIRLQPGVRNNISNNKILANKSGIYLNGGGFNRIHNNYITMTSGHGIKLDKDSSNCISNNLISDEVLLQKSIYDGIHLTNKSTYNFIQNNKIFSPGKDEDICQRYAIRVDSADSIGTLIINNDCYHSSTKPIPISSVALAQFGPGNRYNDGLWWK